MTPLQPTKLPSVQHNFTDSDLAQSFQDHMDFNSEPGPPLRAIEPVELRARTAEQSGVPLRGGFFNPLPNGRSIAFRASGNVETRAAKPSLVRARAAARTLDRFGVDLYARGSSLTDTLNELQKTHCPPYEIVMFPLGQHVGVRPEGAPNPLTFTVNEQWAKLFAHHFDRMKAGGSKPYFDFFHEADCGISGWPKKVFWDHSRGVCALVDWSPEAAELILQGRCNSFSPQWTHSATSDIPFGIGLCLGGLLSSAMKPALQRMPPIQPVRKYDAIALQARRFCHFIEARLPEFGTSEFAAVEAAAAVAAEFPDIFQAHLLLQAIKDESALDLETIFA